MAEHQTGLLIRAVGGFYYVKTDRAVYECKARGSFRRDGNSPLVGDKVKILIPENGYAAIEEILPRKNSLVRPPVANLDLLAIVCSAASPMPNPLVVDKMIAAAVYHGISPAVIVTKTDIGDASDFIEIYKKARIPVFAFSSVTLEGLEEIKAYLKGKITAFTGNSGVGKSTLLNALYPQLGLETGEISRKLGRGRHTTRTVELFEAGGGYAADTPGFSTVDIERLTLIRKDELPVCFPEFEEYLGDCLFASCSHTCEKGCGIIKAVKEGKIPKSRHESYISMYNDVKNIKEWERKEK